jgi:phosphoglycolate phosphatase-like HAD superfamily hydrolase
VVQSLLTGNIRPLAEVKLGPLGLTRHLDLDVGAYGDTHEVRSELVGPARRRAATAYGGDFGEQATVLVGDTPFDIGAAVVTGARAVGVATGGFSVAELARAGADAVLPDLTDTDRVLAAILGQPGGTRSRDGRRLS